MTVINLYGKLAKKFGNKIKLHLGRLNDFIHAVDAIKNGFREELIKLHNEGFDYFYDFSKKNEINVFPILCGSGKGGLFIIIAIILIVLIVVAAAAMAAFLTAAGATSGVGATAAVSTFGVLSGAAAFGAGVGIGASLAVGAIALAFNAAVGLLVAGIQMSTAKTPEMQQQHGSSGGATSSVAQSTKSYIFNNIGNQATQGSPIPIGYGRFRVGSKLIGISIKNYSTNQTYINEFGDNSIQVPNIYD
jgi:predicted phage tail protein